MDLDRGTAGRHDGSMRLPWTMLVLLTAVVPAQTVDDGAVWMAWLAQGRLADGESTPGRLRWWLDAQQRQRDEGEHADLSLLRPALGYALTDRMTLFAGYAWIATDPPRRDEFVEHRAWQQLTWNLPLWGLTVQSRTRLEQRFVETDGDTGWRLREFVKTTVPLTRDKDWFVSLWDELFWDLGDTDWGQRTGFRQNRAFAGLGAFLDAAHRVSVEVGYLNQWVDRRGDDKLNHVLSIMLLTTF
jgi:hypothetical protein